MEETIAATETLLDTLADVRRVKADISSAIGRVPPGHFRESIEAALTFEHPAVVNAIELATLYRLEAACLVQDFHLARGARKAMYSRLLVVSLLESTRTMRGLLGKEFRDEIGRVLGEESLDRLNEIAHQIHAAFEEVNDRFKDLRNELVAHRNADPALRLHHLSNTDGEAIAAMSAAVCRPLTELAELYMPYHVRGLAALHEAAGHIAKLASQA